jgi:hypothetical protein
MTMARTNYTWEKRQKELAKKKKKEEKRQRKLEKKKDPSDAPLAEDLPE